MDRNEGYADHGNQWCLVLYPSFVLLRLRGVAVVRSCNSYVNGGARSSHCMRWPEEG